MSYGTCPTRPRQGALWTKLLTRENGCFCLLAYRLHLIRHQARVADVLRLQPRYFHPRPSTRQASGGYRVRFNSPDPHFVFAQIGFVIPRDSVPTRVNSDGLEESLIASTCGRGPSGLARDKTRRLRWPASSPAKQLTYWHLYQLWEHPAGLAFTVLALGECPCHSQ
jgi:hypothetical protein